MSETPDGLSKCPWCVEHLKKEHLAVHLMKHMEYKKFECGDCSSAFYTEAEREHHCRKKSHMHAFTVHVHPYKEMVLSSFVRDTKYLEVHNASTVLKHRFRLMDELDDLLLDKKEKQVGTTEEKTVRTPVQEASRSKSLTRSSTPKSRTVSRADSISTERSKGASELSKVPLSVVHQSPEIEHRSRKRTETDSSIDIDSVRAENRDGVDLRSPPASTSILNNSNSLSNSTIMLGAALSMTTEILELKCRICKKMVQNDYLIRKDHVTTNHLTADHGPNNYLEIVESKMQSCFPGWTSNDLQCQLGGCGGKTYLSKSGRRGHVLRVHFQEELKCPIAKCTFGATDPARLHQHAKEIHNLNDGYRGMRDQTARQKFDFEKRSHNYKLDQLIQKAFPSAIPDPEYLKVVGAETVSSLIETLRKTERISQPNTVAPPPLRAPSFSDSDSSDSDEEVAKYKKAKELNNKEEEERRRKREKEEEERQRELKRKEKKREEKEERQKEERELERKRLMKEARRLEKATLKQTEQEGRDRAETEKKTPGKLELRHPSLDGDDEKDVKPQPSDLVTIPSLGSTHASVCTVSSVKEEVDDIDDEVQIIESKIKRRVKGDPIFVQKTELCTPPPRKRKLLEAPGGSHPNPQVPVKRALLTTPAGARLVSTDITNNEEHVGVERDRVCHSLSTSVSNVSILSSIVLERFAQEHRLEVEKNKGVRDEEQRVNIRRFNEACKEIQEGQFSFSAWKRVFTRPRTLAIIKGEEECPFQLSTDQRNSLRTLYDDVAAGNIANGKESEWLPRTQKWRFQMALYDAARAAWGAQSTVE